MAADYNNWFTMNDVAAMVESSGVVLRDPMRLKQIIDAVVSEIGQKTLRQFLPDAADTTRVYDGNGTAEIEVDEMVSFTAAVVIGIQSAPGYTIGNVTLISEQGKPQTRLVTGKGSVPAWTTGGVVIPYPAIFPLGRQNIEVTGRFGFAATIPPAVWNAGCGECAYRAAKEGIFAPKGRERRRTEGDVTVEWDTKSLDVATWHGDYTCMLGDWARPSGRRLRNMRTRMI